MTRRGLLERTLYLAVGSREDAAQGQALYAEAHPSLKVIVLREPGELPDFPPYTTVFRGNVDGGVRRALRVKMEADDAFNVDLEYSLTQFSSRDSAAVPAPQDVQTDLILSTGYRLTERLPGTSMPSPAAFREAVRSALADAVARMQASGDLTAAIEENLGGTVIVSQGSTEIRQTD